MPGESKHFQKGEQTHSKKEGSSGCGIKRKGKEKPKGEEVYEKGCATSVAKVQLQSPFCYIGHVICHVLPPLGFIVVDFIISFHLTPLQFYEYVIYQSTCVHVYSPKYRAPFSAYCRTGNFHHFCGSGRIAKL